MNIERMKEQLVLHEGLRLAPYQDTLGIWTWLVGYNLEARGPEFVEKVLGRRISRTMADLTATRDEAMAVLEADILRVEDIVKREFPEYLTLDEVRQRVIIDLAFNLGNRLKNFREAARHARAKNWSGVARELYKSRWANQVDDGEGGRFGRADRLAQMVLTGNDYKR